MVVSPRDTARPELAITLKPPHGNRIGQSSPSVEHTGQIVASRIVLAQLRAALVTQVLNTGTRQEMLMITRRTRLVHAAYTTLHCSFRS